MKEPSDGLHNKQKHEEYMLEEILGNIYRRLLAVQVLIIKKCIIKVSQKNFDIILIGLKSKISNITDNGKYKQPLKSEILGDLTINNTEIQQVPTFQNILIERLTAISPVRNKLQNYLRK